MSVLAGNLKLQLTSFDGSPEAYEDWRMELESLYALNGHDDLLKLTDDTATSQSPASNYTIYLLLTVKTLPSKLSRLLLKEMALLQLLHWTNITWKLHLLEYSKFTIYCSLPLGISLQIFKLLTTSPT